MSVVTEYLIKIIQKNLDESGIVIWYDPRESYRSFIEKIPLDGELLKYQGSYFELRYQLEPYLEGREKKKVLVYIPAEHNEAASPLIEAEYFGTILKPGGPTGKNTRLEIIARNALADLFGTEEIANLEKSIQQGTLALEDLDTLSDTHQETGKAGSLQLIFSSTVPTEIILAFISNPAYDEKISEKKSFDELKTFISAHTGIDSQTDDFSTYRTELARYILITDFLSKIRDFKKITTLGKVPQAKKKGHIEFCRNCVKEWQCRRDLQESYILISARVDEELDLISLDLSVQNNLLLDTFPSTEKLAADYCISCINAGDLKTARKIINDRRGVFWSEVDYKNFRLFWIILSYITDLNGLAEIIRQELKGIGKLTPAKVIEKYTLLSNQNAWYNFDLMQRHLERAYADFDDPQTGDDTPLGALMIRTRNVYSETVNLIAESYSDVLEKNQFSYRGVLTQREIFSKILTPHLLNGKTVYFLIDALRYEMGVDLFNSLEYDDKRIQAAVATAPTITPVGMAALLPQAELSFGIEMGGSPPIGIRINDTLLKTRDDRIQYLQKIIPQKTLFLKLDETLKISKANEKRIKNADLIVVTTQEIDDFSTYKDNKELVRHIMSIVLGQIKRAINNLTLLGIQNFVITADHGHIFGESIGSENKIPPPGGDMQYIDRRSWIGKGGENDHGFMRVNPNVFDIQTDYEFAFPKNIACFKSKGDLVFFHGGLSLQESVIPVIEIVNTAKKEKIPEKGLEFSLTYSKDKITNRFFSIEVNFEWKGVLFGPENYLVRLEFDVEDKQGKAVSASYGLNENTGEVSLKKGEPCHMTLMVPEGISQSKTTIYLVDAGTGKELKKIENLPISLTI